MRRLVALAAPLIAVAVLWNTLSIRASEGNPALAAQVRPGNEIILQRQALLAIPPEVAAGTALPPGALDETVRLGKASLKRSALTPNAAGVVAFASMLRQDSAAVGRLVAVQDRIGWRDRLLLLSAMMHFAGREQPTEAIGAMATLSRIQSTPDPAIFPAIITLSQYDEAMPALIDLLASAPAWRPRFMVVMGQLPENGPLFTRLIDGLLDRGVTIEPDELASFFIVNRTRLPLASQWDLWQRAYAGQGDAARGPLRDGDFEQLSGPPPYSWRVGELEGVTSAIAPRADGKPGQWLEALVDGDAEYEVASQYLTATPGPWTFAVTMDIDSDLTEKTAIAVRCLPDGPTLAERPVARPAGSTRQKLSFTVPAQGCSQQLLTISANRNLSETPFAVRLDDATLERAR